MTNAKPRQQPRQTNSVNGLPCACTDKALCLWHADQKNRERRQRGRRGRGRARRG